MAQTSPLPTVLPVPVPVPVPVPTDAGGAALTGELLTVDGVLPAAAGGDRRLAALTDTWLARQRSAHTRTAYRRDLAGWLAWCAGRGLDPLRARSADVDAWIIAQRLAGARGQPATETTIARRVSTLSSWYGYLVRNSGEDPQPLLTRNPARTDARPRPDPDASTTVGLARAEVARLLLAADADHPGSAALLRLLATTGLRIGAALAAGVEDLGHDRGHRVLDVRAKGGRRRRVPLPPGTADAIDTMLTARGHPATGPLLVTPRGTPMYELYAYRLIRRLAKRVDIPTAGRVSPHSLRHTAITELLDATGGDLRRAQDFADHADPRTTRRYDRARHNLDQHGAYLLADRFSS